MQGPSPRHTPISSALGIAPVVVPPARYPSSENNGPAPVVNAWGKPKQQPAAPVSGLGASLLGTSQGVPGSMGLAAAPLAPPAAPATPIANNDVLSVSDPQVTSSGLLSSSAGTQLSGSFQQQADMKSAERVILPQQARLFFYVSTLPHGTCWGGKSFVKAEIQRYTLLVSAWWRHICIGSATVNAGLPMLVQPPSASYSGRVGVQNPSTTSSIDGRRRGRFCV